MLVLSRRESERIRVGDSIVVTVVKIAGDKVRVGIEAPNEVLVLRDELQVHTPETAPHKSSTRHPTANGTANRSTTSVA